jgi:hypothetical protein
LAFDAVGVEISEFDAIDILSVLERHQEFAGVWFPGLRLWRPVQQCPPPLRPFVLAVIAHL